MNTSIDVRTGEVFEVPTDAPVEDLKIQDVSIPDFQAETLEMLKSDWDACRVTQQEVEEVYFADDLMLSEAGKEEMRQYMKDHPQVKETQPVETQAPVKETKPVETQAPVKETQAVETKPVETQAPETQAPETQASNQNSHNPADYGMTAEEMEQLGLEFADDAFSSLHDEEGEAAGGTLREGQQNIWN